MFRSARAIFWAQPSPSFGGWPSAKRPRDLGVCVLGPCSLAPPTRRWRGRREARHRAQAQAHTRQVDGSSVRARAHLLHRRLARLLKPPAVLARSAFGAGVHSRSSAGSLGAPVPFALRTSARPASVFSERASIWRCPGSGPSVRSSGSRCGTHHAGVAANLRSSARADRPWRDLPSPSEPARVEPVDRRDSCCCLADPEGSESPFTPHRVPLRAWSQGEPDSVEGEKTWSPGNSEGTGWGQWLGPGSFGPAGRGGNEEASRRAGDRREIWGARAFRARRWSGAD
jgi:hypothetical protein